MKAPLFLLPLLLLARTSLAQFSGTTIDKSIVNEAPAIKVDRRTGIEHILYSTDTNMFHATSTDNFEKKEKVRISLQPYLTNIQKSPEMCIGTDGKLRGTFSRRTKNGDSIIWSTMFLNTNDMALSFFPTGDCQSNRSSLVLDNSGNYHVATQVPIGNDIELYYTRFNGVPWTNRIIKKFIRAGSQINPRIKHDGERIRIMWEESIGNTIYLGSINPVITNLENISRSGTNCLSGDFEFNGLTGKLAYKKYVQAFSNDTCDIYVADINVTNGTSNPKRITPKPISSRRNQPVDLSLSEDGETHLSWSEHSPTNFRIMYATSKNNFLPTLVDTSTNTILGWVSIDTYQNKPVILANSHSLVRYSPEQKKPKGTVVLIR